MKKKKAYFVEEQDAEYGVAVVAYSAREAKKLARSDECFEDTEWIDIRVIWKGGIDVADLEIGIIKDYLLALKLGIYGFIEYETCPTCKKEDTKVYYSNGKYYCSHCDKG
jgi:hypothetical protein